MIFVTGGAYAGKTEYVKNNYGENKITVNGLHKIIRDAMANGLDPYDEAEKILAGNPDIVICAEVGSGIVPLDAFEREWRETVGRISCMFAEKADAVIRVVCGIGVKLK